MSSFLDNLASMPQPHLLHELHKQLAQNAPPTAPADNQAPVAPAQNQAPVAPVDNQAPAPAKPGNYMHNCLVFYNKYLICLLYYQNYTNC